MNDAHLNPSVKHDIVMLYDITNGNPNGDPDAGNRPRTDDETSHGITTDVSLKRKIRDTIVLAAQDLGLPPERYQLFVEAGRILDDKFNAALTDAKIDLTPKKGKQLDRDIIAAAHRALYDRYIDIRLFGAVLTANSGVLGHLRGPLQIGFSRSIDPVLPVDHAITRVAPTNETRAEANVRTEMGGKWTVPYALFRVAMHYSAPLAAKTGVTADDLRVLYHAIPHIFEHTRASGRAEMNVQGLYVFSHSTAYGNAPAGQLEARIHIELINKPPRTYADYKVDVHDAGLPKEIVLTGLAGGSATC